MIRKFKHKKINHVVVEKNENGHFIYASNPEGFTFHRDMIVDCDDWVELIEVKKNYEIISLVDKWGEILYNYNVTQKYLEERLIKNSDYRIYSVMRVSDREIFTIGDTIRYTNTYYTAKITDFHNDSNGINMWVHSILFDKPHADSINNIKKITQPLFTTEDGVDIFEGDYTFEIDRDSFRLYLKEYWSKFQKPINKQFSSKEKAEEYILMNKTYLSINSIKKMIEENNLIYSSVAFIDHLKKLVKQKI